MPPYSVVQRNVHAAYPMSQHDVYIRNRHRPCFNKLSSPPGRPRDRSLVYPCRAQSTRRRTAARHPSATVRRPTASADTLQPCPPHDLPLGCLPHRLRPLRPSAAPPLEASAHVATGKWIGSTVESNDESHSELSCSQEEKAHVLFRLVLRYYSLVHIR